MNLIQKIGLWATGFLVGVGLTYYVISDKEVRVTKHRQSTELNMVFIGAIDKRGNGNGDASEKIELGALYKYFGSAYCSKTSNPLEDFTDKQKMEYINYVNLGHPTNPMIKQN